ncbi:UDP-4-amino-4,6-dideoxy-N-acetyl-beta-L-altrosami ne transaminase [Opitutales bacterium ASA1]|uniref:aminotransferase class I/II-fold pyridoxal phosphate-dependent enzyme n=1 Tax=Congregicoccus parvus TaxID=3081749 RepID=UPI002B2AE1A7|nr:UDP-4-amino-4,6-dideoxy-N-acetyl-beta-L-altrosami ne transaminase [Opitutales bacterium ASA1]
MDGGDDRKRGEDGGPSAGDPGVDAANVLPYARQWIDEDDIAAVTAVLRSEWLTQGPRIERFEAELARTFGVAHAVAVSSGTAALHAGVVALGLGRDGIGITSPITFAASANAFLYAGADPVFVDVDPVSGLVRVDSIEEAVECRHRAGLPPGVVVPVSLAGALPDLPALAQVCRRRGWRILEDAAHSPGARRAGAVGEFASAACVHTDAAILSFHPVKHVCAGEGGAVLTNDAAVAEQVRRLRSHGIVRKPVTASSPADEGPWFYEQHELGFHYRMTEMQAALGTSQLTKLPRFLARRRALARRYATELASSWFAEVGVASSFDEGCAYHLYIVHFHDERLRLRAYDWLARQGIRTQVHYIPVYRHPHYRRLHPMAPLDGAERFYRGCLSLPLFPAMTDEEQTRVIDALRVFVEEEGR